jgi:transcriptional regulator with XRE-family HTH domain
VPFFRSSSAFNRIVTNQPLTAGYGGDRKPRHRAPYQSVSARESLRNHRERTNGRIFRQVSTLRFCLTYLAMLNMVSSMPKSIQTLATFLAEARTKAGLTLRAVEKGTGVSNAYLSQLEHGKIQTPAPQYLHKLAALYRVPYELLMELAGYPVPKSAGSGTQAARDTMAARIGTVTRKEEDALVEYLQFIRLRKRSR